MEDYCDWYGMRLKVWSRPKHMEYNTGHSNGKEKKKKKEIRRQPKYKLSKKDNRYESKAEDCKEAYSHLNKLPTICKCDMNWITKHSVFINVVTPLSPSSPHQD